MKRNNLKFIKIIFNVIIIFMIFYFSIRHLIGYIMLNKYLSDIEKIYNISKPYDKEEVITLVKHYQKNINCKDPTIAINRPKIGWTLYTILKRKQGLCGEGARLLFHSLALSGIQSRRIYMHGNNGLHVILEFKNNNKWLIMETINGFGEDFNRKVFETDITLDSLFSIGPYRFHYTPKNYIYNYGINNFSYLPLNGVLNNKTFKTEIYVHKPLPFFVNYILESPDLLYVIILLIILLIINLKVLIIYVKIRFVHAKKQI